MGEDVPEAIRYFGKRRRINFVHFRDVRGTAPKFAETFHDDGQTDMLAALRALKEVDYDGSVRPDHQPRTVGTEALPEYSGYRLLGKFYGIAYLKGLMEAVYGKHPISPLRL
jgi:mannonate dehydratase